MDLFWKLIFPFAPTCRIKRATWRVKKNIKHWKQVFDTSSWHCLLTKTLHFLNQIVWKDFFLYIQKGRASTRSPNEKHLFSGLLMRVCVCIRETNLRMIHKTQQKHHALFNRNIGLIAVLGVFMGRKQCHGVSIVSYITLYEREVLGSLSANEYIEARLRERITRFWSQWHSGLTQQNGRQ